MVTDGLRYGGKHFRKFLISELYRGECSDFHHRIKTRRAHYIGVVVGTNAGPSAEKKRKSHVTARNLPVITDTTDFKPSNEAKCIYRGSAIYGHILRFCVVIYCN